MTEKKVIYKFTPSEQEQQPEDYLTNAIDLVEAMRYSDPCDKAATLAMIAMAQAMNDLVHVMENVLKIMEQPK